MHNPRLFFWRNSSRWRAFAERFTDSARRLEEVNNGTEKGFLQLGEKLLDYHRQVGGLESEACSAAGILCGDGMAAQIGGLSAVLDEAHRAFSETDTKMDKALDLLRGFAARLGEVCRALDSLRDITRMMEMLSVAVRIENARLMREDTGFGTLSEEVRKQAEDIKAKSIGIQSKAAGLEERMIRRIARSEQLAVEHRDASKTVMDGIVENLEGMNRRQKASEATLHTLAEEAGAIRRQMGDIVVAVQFHDITRQQIEHVEEALREIAGRMESFPTGRQQENGRNALAGAALEAGRLQVSQASMSRTELSQAVAAIKTRLGDIAVRVGAMRDRSDELTGAAGSGDSLSRMEGEIRKIGTTLGSAATVNRELREVMDDMVEAMGEIAGYVKEIDSIGIEIRMIALNAIIKADHIGVEGAALSVLAESITMLSKQVNDTTAEISDFLRAINEMACRTKESMGSVIGDESSTEDLVGKLSTLTDSLQANRKRLENILAGVRDVSLDLERDLTEFSRKIDVHDRVCASLDGFVADMEGILKDLGHFRVKAGEGRDIERFFPQIAMRYTMEKERYVHSRDMMGGPAPAAESERGVPAPDAGGAVSGKEGADPGKRGEPGVPPAPVGGCGEVTVVDAEIIPEAAGPAPGSEGAGAPDKSAGAPGTGTPEDDFGDNVELF